MTNSETAQVLADDQTKGSHTPGPWMVGDEVGKTQMHLMVYCDDALGSRIADCSNSGHGLTDEQDRANVRLIAAAPDMLHALRDAEEALRRSYDATEYPADGTSVQERALKVVQAAIAKAEGRS